MITQLRRYWPVLAALSGIGVYGANHFRIAGIEHLRLVPLPAKSSGSQGQVVANQQGPWPSLNHGTGNRFTPQSFSGTTSADLPVWQENLSIGDKLAMLEESPGQTDASPAPGPLLPFSSPIPLPNNYRDGASAGLVNLPKSEPPSTGANRQTFAVDTRLRPVGSDIPSTTDAPAQPKPAPKKNFQSSESRIAELASRAKNALVSEAHDVGQTIRVASFNITSLGPAKLSKPRVLQTLVGVLKRFDVIALQEVRSTRDDVLPLLVDALNQTGGDYDFVIGPRVGSAPPYDQFAIVFNKERVETDRIQLYTVSDPEDLIRFEPLVGWFRCKNVPAGEAFTFSLVNFRLDPDRANEERELIPTLVDAIRADGRGEDDWIMAGDVADGLDTLSNLSGARFAIRDMPTDVAGTRLMDTIFFSSTATGEFTGRCGTFDFLRKGNMSLESALEVSEHLPVWAEFSVIEGEQPGRLAPVLPLTAN